MSTDTTSTERQTFECPFCHLTAANEFLLTINHGPESFRAQRDGTCMAQWLTSNHIRVFAAKVADRKRKRSAAEDQSLREQLAERVARGRELGLDVDALLVVDREPLVCGPCRKGGHFSCMEDATWDRAADDVGTCTCSHAQESAA